MAGLQRKMVDRVSGAGTQQRATRPGRHRNSRSVETPGSDNEKGCFEETRIKKKNKHVILLQGLIKNRLGIIKMNFLDCGRKLCAVRVEKEKEKNEKGITRENCSEIWLRPCELTFVLSGATTSSSVTKSM